MAVVAWHVDAGVWPWLVASGLLRARVLRAARHGLPARPLSVVYPIARGGAPVLVLVIGVVALGRGTSWSQVAGSPPRRGRDPARARRPGRPIRAALAFGVAIAFCIAGYTLVDKQGVRHAGPIPYLELSMAGPAILYSSAVVRMKGAAAVRAAFGTATFVAGIATFGAYALVLAALERASAASVAAVRETSVVIAAALASVVLKEQVGPVRIAGAVLVVGGIALLAR